ncbi:FAD-dependent 5-carboxymethylaminomethyl-2-thiouridine(34) oxidoreductase MnmC, partial [Chitinimonas sp.]|uniref:FAD-dependent 5-carboxymethylaminomethyl-2-thiouridine(34) oxidoreductase MnmC n=1 Tax=Chitinimonas sp. TaxID=1934313 RepID=UPI0035AFC3CE
FAICETGFGLGLSFLDSWAAWQADPQRSTRLHFVSCELHPFTRDDLRQLHARLFADQPTLLALSRELLASWPPLMAGSHRIELAGGQVVLTLLFGDAMDCLCNLAGKFDAFYLDGFAPAKNPDLWQLPLFKQLARLVADQASIASYTVAGEVRRALQAAGFVVEKRAGFAGKRHCLGGVFRGKRPPATVPARHAIVIGAGLAGAAISERLAQRGWQISLLERHAAPAQEASGNHAGAYRPVVALDDNLQARLARAAFLYGLRQFRQLPGLIWQACGAVQLARDADEQAKLQQIAAAPWPADYLQWLERDAASALAGKPLASGGLWFAQAGWVKPTSLVHALLAKAGKAISTQFGATVSALHHDGQHWQALDDSGTVLASAPVLILANAADAMRFAPELGLSADERVVSLLAGAADPAVRTVVCGGAYLTPAHDGLAALGSSPASPTALADNLALLGNMLPQVKQATDTPMAWRQCARPNSIDRLPLVGPLVDSSRWQPKYAGSLHLAPRRTGLFALTGFGARGLVWCNLLAELLASQICGEPLPLERDLVNALDPARFLARHGATSP